MSTTIAASTLTATLANAIRARFPRWSEPTTPTAAAVRWLCAEIELRDATSGADIAAISKAADGFRTVAMSATEKNDLCSTLVDAALAWSEPADSVENVDARTSQTLLTTITTLATRWAASTSAP